MASKQSITQQTTQTQTLSQLQFAVATMIELPLPELEEMVKNEMEDNSAIEESENDAEIDADDLSSEVGEEGENRETGEASDEMADYLTADDVPEYIRERADSREMQQELPFAGGESFFEKLRAQIGEHPLTEHEAEVLEYLIGSLNDDGYLKKELWNIADELAVYHNTETSEEELERLLHVLQTFEPRGIGARTPQECLRIQLLSAEHKTPAKQLALEIINDCYDDFMNKRWDEICRKLRIPREQFDEALHELMRLNPKPGNALNEETDDRTQSIVPDIFVEIDDFGEAVITLNRGGIPALHVSRAFRDSIQEFSKNRLTLSPTQKEEFAYVRDKVQSAQIFIEALRRRHQALLIIMHAIVERQRDFFDEDDELLLKPLTQKEISKQTGLAASTISRTVSTKYVQTRFGVYPLKKFFGGQITFNGDEDVAVVRIKDCLRNIIEHEDKTSPLSDERLTAEMAKRGFPIARRTVTKYRLQMNIPTARLRK